jgi:hypothetical protein
MMVDYREGKETVPSPSRGFSPVCPGTPVIFNGKRDKDPFPDAAATILFVSPSIPSHLFDCVRSGLLL